ncbi:MAG TPA: AMP-binding protein, partial [Burkholderiales bacterium]|nr:AMP-binding protein [Burkholderiales bacterium]
MRKPLEVLRLYAEHNYTLNGAFASRAVRNPQREFILFNGKSWSWQAFGEAVERTARLFVSRGVKKGDRVGVMARNCDGHVLALLALARIGAIMVPVNPEFGIHEANYVFHHAEVSAVLATNDTLAVARQAADGLPVPPWFALFDGAAEGAPPLADLAAA